MVSILIAKIQFNRLIPLYIKRTFSLLSLSHLHLLCCGSATEFASHSILWPIISLIVEIFVVWHSTFIILHHIVNSDLKILNALFFLNIQLLEVEHTEVVYDLYDHLIQFKELLIEKVPLVHLVLNNLFTRVRLRDLV